jgi:hypothetical protein
VDNEIREAFHYAIFSTLQCYGIFLSTLLCKATILRSGTKVTKHVSDTHKEKKTGTI